MRFAQTHAANYTEWVHNHFVDEIVNSSGLGPVRGKRFYNIALNQLNDIKQKLINAGGRLIVDVDNHQQTYDCNIRVCILLWEDIGATIIGSHSDNVCGVLVNGINEKRFEFLCELIKSYDVLDKSYIYILDSTYAYGNSAAPRRAGVIDTLFEPSNYPSDVVRGLKHVVEDLQNPNPCGNITILEGEPGTGKTYFLRSLVNQLRDVRFVLMPANLVGQIFSPNFISSLSRVKEGQVTVLLIEDADFLLIARASDNMSEISSLLNLGDGILGRVFDLRIICTTNIRTKEIDKAILRDGRLCKHIKFDHLDSDQASSIYYRLTNDKKVIEPCTLASVYKKANEFKGGQ